MKRQGLLKIHVKFKIQYDDKRFRSELRKENKIYDGNI